MGGELLLLEFFILVHAGHKHLCAVLSLSLCLCNNLTKPVAGHSFFNQVRCLFALVWHLEAALHQNQYNALKADGKAARRYVLPCKPADHLVIAPAAATAYAKLRHHDLKDCACIIGHTAHQCRIKDKLETVVFCGIDALDNLTKARLGFLVKKSGHLFLDERQPVL